MLYISIGALEDHVQLFTTEWAIAVITRSHALASQVTFTCDSLGEFETL